MTFMLFLVPGLRRGVCGLIAPDLWRGLGLNLQMSPELPEEL